MAKKILLDELLRSLHNAVLEAQKLTEQQHIRQLHKYFYWPDHSAGPGAEGQHELHDGDIVSFEGGVARTWTIKVPDMRPDAPPGSMTDIVVPLMSLIPPSAIKIKNMSVEFKAGLGGLADADHPQKTGTRYVPGDPERHKGEIQLDLGGISGGFFGKSSNKQLAKIRIDFESGEPAESFLRINDHLVKSIV